LEKHPLGKKRLSLILASKNTDNIGRAARGERKIVRLGERQVGSNRNEGGTHLLGNARKKELQLKNPAGQKVAVFFVLTPVRGNLKGGGDEEEEGIQEKKTQLTERGSRDASSLLP